MRNVYFRRTRNLLKTKLCRVDPLVSYAESLLKWTREEIQQMDRKARKLMTKPNIDRLYVARKKGERGFTCIKDSEDASIQLKDFIKKSKNGQIIAYPLSWSCRIHRQLLCRGVKPPLQ